MEIETEKNTGGLKLGGLISIVVGVISLIVIIPTISNIMSPEDPPLEEYHIKTDWNDSTYYMTFSGPTLSASNFDFSYFDSNLVEISIKSNEKIYIFESFTISHDNPLHSFNISSGGNSGVFNFDINTPYGIYDFRGLTVSAPNQTLVPIYTAF